MTIQLTKDTYVAGVLSAAGSQHTLDAQTESYLVHIGAATWVETAYTQGRFEDAKIEYDSDGVATGIVGRANEVVGPVWATDDFGNVTGLVGPGGSKYFSPKLSGETAYPGFFAKRPLQNVAIPFGTAAINDKNVTGTTVATAVDAAETFNGKPSTKCTVAGAGSTVNLDVGVSAATITLDATCQGVLTASTLVAVKIGNGNTVASGVLYLGDATYSNFYTLSLSIVGYDGDWVLLGTVGFGAASKTGTPDLAANVRARVRVVMAENVAAGDVWVSECYVLPKCKPTVVFTCDDGYDEWEWLADEAAKRGIPISFGIAQDYVGTDGFLTEAQLLLIGNHSSGLFEITNHGRVNTNYSVAGLATYRAAMDSCRDYLIGLGLDPVAAKCHQYVQGIFDQTLIDSIKDAGYVSAREVGTANRHASGHAVAIDGTDCDSKFKIPATVNLTNTVNLATVQASLINAAQNGGAFIMGHRFAAVEADITWINGYDADHGVLNLLDWLAQKRDDEGWQILKWSDWQNRVHRGYEADILL